MEFIKMYWYNKGLRKLKNQRKRENKNSPIFQSIKEIENKYNQIK